jgi:uncharacterized delta-60 repeat protein
VSRLTATIALFLVAVAMLVQAGSAGVQRADAGGSTGTAHPVGVPVVVARPSSTEAPDPGFGAGGGVVIDFGGFDRANAVAQQADGKILVAGWARPDEIPGVYEYADAVVVRLMADGTPDATFGVGGVAILEGGDYYFNDLAVQPDGKIIAAGTSVINVISADTLVARFNANGTLDTTFASDGVFELNLGGRDRAEAVALQTDGKIVLGGGADNKFAATRLLSDGALDVTFDTDGMATIFLTLKEDRAYDVAIQPDGKIVLAGTAAYSSFGGEHFGLVRLLADGSLDPTFDGDGKAILDLGIQASGYGAALQADGKIVIVGETFVPGDRNAIVVRTTGSGALDSTFGSDGVVSVGFGKDFEQFDDVTIQPDGNIVVAGSSGDAQTFDGNDFVVGRLLPDGSLDPEFGGGGAIVDFGGDDRARAVAVQADGKILAAGETDGDWAILRLRASDTNTPPVLDAIGDQALAEADTVDVGISATDADGDPLTFTLSGEPSFATLTDHGGGTATLTLTPGFDDAGSYTGVTVTVSDSIDSDSETFTITVTDTNRAPVLDAIGDQTVAEADTVDVGISATDADSDSLTFTLSGEPSFATLTDHGDGTATLTLAPGLDRAGVYPGVTVTVSDSVDTDTETFTITVKVEGTMHLFLPLVLQSH